MHVAHACVRRVTLGVLIAGAACRLPAPGAVQAVSWRDEEWLFEDVVQRIAAERGPRLLVDVRSLRPSHELVVPRLEDLQPQTSDELARRRKVVAAAGAATADAVVAMSCPGWTLVLTDSTLSRTCPRDVERLIVIALSRPGPATFPDGSPAPMRGESSSSRMRSVRVLLLQRTPRGNAVTTYDHVYYWTDTGWRFLVKVPLYVME